MSDSTPALTFGRADYRTALLGISAANVVVVLIMAVLGGRFFVSPSVIDVHGYLGNFLFLMVIGQAALLVLSKPGGRFGKAILGMSLLTVLLVVGQIGLGYSARTSINALSWHIPNGVLIIAVSTAILAQLPHARNAKTAA